MVNANKYKDNISIITPEFYNYGSLLIAGIIRNQNYNVSLYRGFPEKNEHKINFISLQSTIHLIKYKEQIESLNGIKIIGGPVTNVPQLVFDNLDVDIVVIGEAEETIPELLQALNKGYKTSRLTKVEGIAYKDGDHIVQNKLRKPSTEIKRPLPLIPNKIDEENIRGANVYIETHRGCSGNCGFCQVPCFFGQNVRSRREKDIIKEVKRFKENGADRIAISGGTGTLYGSDDFSKIDDIAFTSLLRKISEIVGPENLTIPDIRVDLITPQTLQAIKMYTNGWVFFGIESGSPEMLKKMQKGITLDSIHNAVKMARDAGLNIAGSFITAYPGETQDDFDKTLDLIADLSLDDYFISIAEPIPGTKLADEIINCPEEENLLNIPSKKYKREGYNVAQERALDMMLESYMFRSHPILMTNTLYDTLNDEVKLQNDHIKSVIKLLKQDNKTTIIKQH